MSRIPILDLGGQRRERLWSITKEKAAISFYIGHTHTRGKQIRSRYATVEWRSHYARQPYWSNSVGTEKICRIQNIFEINAFLRFPYSMKPGSDDELTTPGLLLDPCFDRR